MKYFSQRGFAVIEILLLVIAASIIGFGGYYVWHSQKQTDKSLTQANQVSQSSVSSNLYTGWKTYTANLGKFTLKYPSDWSVIRNESKADTNSDPDEFLELKSPSGSDLMYSYSQGSSQFNIEPSDFYGCGHQSACYTYHVSSVSSFDSGSLFGKMYVVHVGTNTPVNDYAVEGYITHLYKPLDVNDLPKTGDNSFNDKGYSFDFYNTNKDWYSIMVSLPDTYKSKTPDATLSSPESKTIDKILESLRST